MIPAPRRAAAVVVVVVAAAVAAAVTIVDQDAELPIRRRRRIASPAVLEEQREAQAGLLRPPGAPPVPCERIGTEAIRTEAVVGAEVLAAADAATLCEA